jgi:hypothetical protein
MVERIIFRLDDVNSEGIYRLGFYGSLQLIEPLSIGVWLGVGHSFSSLTGLTESDFLRVRTERQISFVF